MLAGKKIDPMEVLPQGTTRDIVAEKTGLGSGKHYEQIERVINASKELPEAQAKISYPTPRLEWMSVMLLLPLPLVADCSR